MGKPAPRDHEVLFLLAPSCFRAFALTLPFAWNVLLLLSSCLASHPLRLDCVLSLETLAAKLSSLSRLPFPSILCHGTPFIFSMTIVTVFE